MQLPFQLPDHLGAQHMFDQVGVTIDVARRDIGVANQVAAHLGKENRFYKGWFSVVVVEG